MRYRLATIAFVTLVVLVGLGHARPPTSNHDLAQGASAPQNAQPVLVAPIDGSVGPAQADWIRHSLRQAKEVDAQALVLRLNTPGGLAQSTRTIIQAILTSPVPVIGWIGPRGAQAARTGLYILYACHIAAMAPGTHLGIPASIRLSDPLVGPGSIPLIEEEPTPQEGGQTTGWEQGDPAQSGQSPKRGRKTVRNAIISIRSLADLRQRNRAWPTGAIQRGAWLSAEEAATKRVVELLAASVREVLTKIDGGAVATPGGERTLTVADAPVHKLNPDWRTQLLGSLANPNVVYILMLIGVYGLIFELVHPGAILPGIVGAVCLGLAVYAFQDLAINYTGLGLILLSLLLFLGEVIAPSFGGLGLGGWVTFVLGSTSLIEADGTGPGLAWPVIGTGSLATGTFVLIVSTLALRSFRRRPVSGVDTLIGRTAITLEPLHPEGRVRINGESWRACAEEAVPQGATVIVVRIEGLTLHVARTAERHQ